jgi:hypothetical protein
MILMRKSDIMAADFDAAEIHQLLRMIPDDIDIEELIKATMELYIRYPPSMFIENEHSSLVVMEMIKEEFIYEIRIIHNQKPANSIVYIGDWRRLVISFALSALVANVAYWVPYIYKS